AEGMAPDASARYVIHVNRGYLALRQGQRARARLGPAAGGAAGGVVAVAGPVYFARAARDLREAVRVKPDSYHAHVNLAQAYRELHQLDRSLGELGEAIRLEPDRPALYRTRARLLLEMRDPGGALRDLDRAVVTAA